MRLEHVLLQCLYQNYHADKSNAAIHCAEVRFSPLTFRIAEALLDLWREDIGNKDLTQELAEVRSHMNQYAEDKGR